MLGDLGLTISTSQRQVPQETFTCHPEDREVGGGEAGAGPALFR